MAEEIEVQVLIQEIRDRVRQSGPLPPGLLTPDLEALKKVHRDLHLRRSLVGKLPPSPPTLRGRVGGLMVKTVRRSLFWFLSRLDRFHSDIIEEFDLQFAVLNSLSWMARENVETLAHFKTKLAELSAELNRPAGGERGSRVDGERLRAEGAEGAEGKAMALAVAQRCDALEANYRRMEAALRRLNPELSVPGGGIADVRSPASEV